MMGSMAFAQLPNGSIAPDFTATDINGEEHNLYNLLDDGYKVIVDFSATWCGPCWSYHTSGVFEELYSTYGPDGTDEIRIFFIEADDTTTDDDLHGTGPSTMGDWTDGTEYPIIDNGGDIFDDYAGAYYPTIYTICPNRLLTESSQVSVEQHAAIFQANDCAAATLPNDPALLDYTGGITACPGEEVPLSVQLMNLGVSNLYACTIAVMDGSTELLSYDWSGDLGTYDMLDVPLGGVAFDNSTDFDLVITSVDDNDMNNTSSGAVTLATDATSLIKIELGTDGWGYEIDWFITDDSGNVVASLDEELANESEYLWWVSVPSTGCYTFNLTDSYGDGINGTIWGSIDGYCNVKSYDDNLTFISTIYDYDGSYGFEVEMAGMSVTSVNTGITEQTLNEVTRVFPNPFTDQTNLEFSTNTSSDAGVIVYNLVGEQVMNIALGTLQAGEHNVILDFSGIQAGVYLISLTAGEQATTMRVTLK